MRKIYLCTALAASVWGVQMASAREITADETVPLTADNLYVNGVLQPRGAYRYDTIQDATVKAHFDPASTGTLIVRGDGGFSFTIR